MKTMLIEGWIRYEDDFNGDENVINDIIKDHLKNRTMSQQTWGDKENNIRYSYPPFRTVAKSATKCGFIAIADLFFDREHQLVVYYTGSIGTIIRTYPEDSEFYQICRELKEAPYEEDDYM